MKLVAAILFVFCSCCFGAFQSLPTGGSAMIEIPGGLKNIDSSTNAITIAMWAYLTSPFANNVHDLMCKGRSNNANKVLFHLRWRTNFYQFRYASPDGTFHDWQTTSTYSTNVLRHIAVTYQYGTAASLKFYVDGEPVGGSWVNGTGAANGLTNDQSFTTSGVVLSDSGCKGILNDVAVWYDILSATEIKNLAQSKVKRMPLQYRPWTIIVYYPLDDWAAFPVPNEPANGERFMDLGYQRYVPRLQHAATPDVVMKNEYFLSYPPNE